MDEVIIRGLRQLDYLDLQKSLQTDELRLIEKEHVEGQFREPGTIAVLLVLSSGSVFALATWLLKGRKKNKIILNMEKRRADGSSETVHFEHVLATSEMPKAAEIAAIAKGLSKVLGVTFPSADKPA